MRIHELAKELNVESARIIEFLNEQGAEISNQLAGVSPNQQDAVREKFAPEPEEPAAEPVEEESSGPAEEASPPEADASDTQADEDDEDAGEAEKSSVVEVKTKVGVRDFSEILDMKPNRVIAELMKENVFASINAEVDFAVAKKIAAKHGIELVKKKKRSEQAEEAKKPKEDRVKKEEDTGPVDRDDALRPRAPVVSFLGHVDHGKTSLLDKIRKATVAEGEAGGITQHIGAYTVDFHDHMITFLDTPGHAAFTAMRARGANLTDIVVLIVAADDGVMPQTKEAIQHAKAAKVTIVVAANKMDLPGANLDKVYQGLMEAGLVPEQLGGDVGVVPVSAKTGDGIEDLLEHINLESEMLELQANPDRPADGYVVEAELEQGRGPTATLLIKRGTLKVGDALVSGACWGKINALINDKGNMVRKAGPSDAVKCMGLNSVPEAGAQFVIKTNDREAKAIAEERVEQNRQESLKEPQQEEVTLESLFGEAGGDEKKELTIVLKCDVQGSLEAVEQTLGEIESEKVSPNIILSAVGNITENDVLLAKASGAVVLGFNVSKESGVAGKAKKEGVEIRLYSVIYELLDDVKMAMTGLLEPEYREKPIGRAEIRQVFDIGKQGKIAGCMVVEGAIRSNGKARVTRKKDTLYEGSISSLKRFQNDAREVRDGQECGIALDNFYDFEEGDIIECFLMEKLEQKL